VTVQAYAAMAAIPDVFTPAEASLLYLAIDGGDRNLDWKRWRRKCINSISTLEVETGEARARREEKQHLDI
jgi:hypothetical protein